MDLQKDEDFEKAWQENRHIWESTKNLAKAMFYAGQAKSQADQKIKLLLCDEHLKKCESPTGVFNSQYPDEEPCLICLAKQYKAQAVPEGFVVVPKEPTQELLNKMQDFFVGAFENGLTGGQSIHCAYTAMVEAQEQANDS